MKKIHLIFIYFLIISVAVFCSINFFILKKQRIACIDTARVLKSYKGIEALSSSIETKNKNFKLALDTLANEFQAAVKEYEKMRSTLSAKEVKEEEAKLRSKQDEYSQFSNSNQEQLKKEELKIVELALERINAQIIRYAKTQNYSAVLSITPTSGIIYVNDYLDITEDIIKLVNH